MVDVALGTSHTVDGPRAVGTLAAAGTELRLPAGRVLHRQGESAGGLVIVLDGQVQLTVAIGDGQEMTLAVVDPGGIVGIVSTVDGGPHTATATTVSECRVALVGRRDLHDLMTHDAAVSSLLVHQLAGHLRQADARLLQRCSESTLARVVARLRDLWGRVGGERIETTQQELADWVGSSRESTARALASLRDVGAIRTGRGWIEVVDDDLLAAPQG